MAAEIDGKVGNVGLQTFFNAEVESCSGSGSECVHAVGSNITLPGPIHNLLALQPERGKLISLYFQ